MDFFETPEEIANQLDTARARLKEFEDRVDADVLMTRLRAAHPAHPALLARVAFLSLSLLGMGAAVGVAVVTLTVDPRSLPPALTRIDASVGMPLPVVFGVFSICLAVAWIGAGQAALQIARDCPLLPHELRDHERLLNEVKRLSSQKAIMDRVRGTPMGARPRSMTPSGAGSRGLTPTAAPTRGGVMNSMPSYVAPSRAGAMNSMPSYIAQPTRPGSLNSQAAMPAPTRPGSMNSQTSMPAMPSRPGSLNSQAAAPPPAIGTPSSRLASGPKATPTAATPLAAPVRGGTPIGKLGAQRKVTLPGPDDRDPVDEHDTLSDEDDVTGEAAPGIFDVPVIKEEDETFTGGPLKAVPTALRRPTPPPSVGGSGVTFEQRYATHFPQWGAVDEPWLEDAIQKSEILATGFPVQARMIFSQDAGLPFSLILERATPAMAVRAMVSYVEFLASIATPQRARIVLRSVPHLDRSFHRNVEAALEPYFADKCAVRREADYIDIRFNDYDKQWDDHPWLPIEQS